VIERDYLAAGLAPIVRVALRRGVGLPALLDWTARAARALDVEIRGADDAARVTDLLCDVLQHTSSNQHSLADDTVVGA